MPTQALNLSIVIETDVPLCLYVRTYKQSGTSVSITMDKLSAWVGTVFSGTINSDGSQITAYGVTYTAV